MIRWGYNYLLGKVEGQKEEGKAAEWINLAPRGLGRLDGDNFDP